MDAINAVVKKAAVAVVAEAADPNWMIAAADKLRFDAVFKTLEPEVRTVVGFYAFLLNLLFLLPFSWQN